MICSVTVTLNPDRRFLRQQIDALVCQVDRILLIDNGSGEDAQAVMDEVAIGDLVEMECLGRNTGLAAAQNVGIRRALALGAHAVLLLDQDSLPCLGMVLSLREALHDDPLAAAAGPVRIDRRTGTLSHFVTDAAWWPRRWRPMAQEPEGKSSDVGVLIASGSLIRSQALQASGLMREDLFIDHVDTEWCLRMRSRGWRLLGVPDARMAHSVGEAVNRVWWFGWREIALHSFRRSYFVNRNTLLLLVIPSIPARWKVFIAARTLILDCYLLVVVPGRIHRCRMILTGLLHGLLGRSGPWSRG